MTHINRIINNNFQKYCVIPKKIADSLGIDFGDYVKINIQGRSVLITKISTPSESELSHNRKVEANLDFNFEAPKKNRNQPNSRTQTQSKSRTQSKSQSIVVTEDQIKEKIISIIEQNQIIELSYLLSELDIEHKPLAVKVIKDLLDSNKIQGKEENDFIYFTLPP